MQAGMSRAGKRWMWGSLLALALLAQGCNNGNPTGNDGGGGEIEDYLRKMDFNADLLLNVQETGNNDNLREEGDSDTTEVQVGNNLVTCRRTAYNLKQNFDNLAILRPTTGIVWPGALVKGNQSLMDGVPDPIGLPRSTVTLSVDLPGIGQNGIVQVQDATNSSVQAAVDDALSWWNNNAYQEGYVNPSNSSFKFSRSYSSEQLSLDLGVNAAWASNEVNSQFNFSSSETKTVVMAVYKQGFYSVNFDVPTSPAAVFAESVSIEDVQNTLNAADAPAYINSVVYGRIIMFRMETSTSVTATGLNVETALKYAAGVSVDLTLESEYQRILNNSSIEVLTIGGNASVASEVVSAQSFGDLLPIIQGENAVYSINNPGVPIAYTVRYLKDNSLAKLGYTTDYVATECVATQNRNTVKITLDRFYILTDCDGIEGDGEFYLYGRVFKNGGFVEGRTKGGNSFDDAVILGPQSSSSLNYEIIFTIDRREGQNFKVAFFSSEWDKNIFGTTYEDSRMDQLDNSITHRFSSGNWTNIGNPGTIHKIFNGSGDCQAELWYKVDVY